MRAMKISSRISGNSMASCDYYQGNCWLLSSKITGNTKITKKYYYLYFYLTIRAWLTAYREELADAKLELRAIALQHELLHLTRARTPSSFTHL
jgi:hypothetical protein